jgi:hypothetical protein
MYKLHVRQKTVGEAMNDLLNPALLNKLVPGWDKPLMQIHAGDTVSFVPGLSLRNTQVTLKLFL